MKADRFYELMSNYNNLQEKDLVELQGLIDIYPYFQTARVLWNYNLAKMQNVHTAAHLKTTAAYAGDRARLFSIFHQKSQSLQHNVPNQTSKTGQSSQASSKNNATASSKTTERKHKSTAKESPKADTKTGKTISSRKDEEDKLIKKSVQQAKATSDAKKSQKKTTKDILAERTANKKVRKATFMKVYYATEPKNVTAFFKQEDFKHEVIRMAGGNYVEQPKPLSEEDVENFIKYEVEKLKSEPAPKEEPTTSDKQQHEEAPEKLDPSNVDHEQIIDKLIVNLRKAKDQAIALADDDLSSFVDTDGDLSEFKKEYENILNDAPGTKSTAKKTENTEKPSTKDIEVETSLSLDSGSLVELAIKGKELGRTYIPLPGEEKESEKEEQKEYRDMREDIDKKTSSQPVKEKEQQSQNKPIVSESQKQEDTPETLAERVLRQVAEKKSEKVAPAKTETSEKAKTPPLEESKTDITSATEKKEEIQKEDRPSVSEKEQENNSETLAERVLRQVAEKKAGPEKTETPEKVEPKPQEEPKIDVTSDAEKKEEKQQDDRPTISEEEQENSSETKAERVLRQVAEKRDKLRKEKENATTSNKRTEEEKKNSDPTQEKRQLNLIDRFIEEQPSIKRNVEAKAEGDLEEVKDSVRENEDLATEALAKMYITQKYYAKAIATYQKLSLKYPEKNTYFADQIENVKKLMNQE